MSHARSRQRHHVIARQQEVDRLRLERDAAHAECAELAADLDQARERITELSSKLLTAFGMLGATLRADQ